MNLANVLLQIRVLEDAPSSSRMKESLLTLTQMKIKGSEVFSEWT